MTNINKYHFISFLFPIIIFLSICYFFNIGIGEYSIATFDAKSQYCDFFSWLRNTIVNGDSLLYSFSKGLGGETFSLIAYYLASIFSFIVIFFDTENMQIAFLIMLILKIGTAGLTSYIFLTTNSLKIPRINIIPVILSTGYALQSYIICYNSNIMWLDAVIFLPIVMLGVINIYKEKSPMLYIISLSLTILSNYYIAFSVCIFLLLFCLTLHFAYKIKIKSFINFLGSSILSAGICSFLLIPIYFTLLNGQLSSFPKHSNFSITFPIFQIIPQILLGKYTSLKSDGDPLSYIGIPTICFVLLLFFSKETKIRTKIAFLLLPLIIVLGMIFKASNLFWSFGVTPNWYPYRYSFVIPAILLFYCKTFLENPYKISKNNFLILITILNFLLLFPFLFNYNTLFFETRWQEALLPKFLDIIIINLIVFCLFFIVRKKYLSTSLLSLSIFLTLSTIDISTHVYSWMKYLKKETRLYTVYKNFMINNKDLISNLPPSKNFWYRTGALPIKSNENYPLSLSINGITHFSSSYNSKITVFHKKLIDRSSSFWLRTKYNQSILPTDSFLGIKYILNDSSPSPFYKAYNNNSFIYENPFALPLGFIGNKGLATLKLKINSVLKNQNKLFHALTNKNILTKIKNIKTSNPSTNHKIHFTATDNPIYLEIENIKKAKILIFKNGKKEAQKQFINNDIISLKGISKGDKVVVQILTNNSIYTNDIFCYELDMTQFKDAINTLKSKGMHLTKIHHSYLKGYLNNQKGGTVFTTIPFDKGWRIKINGKEAKVKKYLDALIYFDIPAGKNKIEFLYFTYKLKLGIIISLIFIFLTIFINYKYFKRKLT